MFDSMEKPAFVFDGRNLLDHEALHAIGFNVFPIGKPPLKHFLTTAANACRKRFICAGVPMVTRRWLRKGREEPADLDAALAQGLDGRLHLLALSTRMKFVWEGTTW